MGYNTRNDEIRDNVVRMRRSPQRGALGIVPVQCAAFGRAIYMFLASGRIWRTKNDRLKCVAARLALPKMANPGMIEVCRPLRHKKSLATLGTFDDREAHEFCIAAGPIGHRVRSLNGVARISNVRCFLDL
jgi:hypothetical protein